MIVVNLEQGSPDWLVWRESGIGASDAPVIYWGKHFDQTIASLWREKTTRRRTGKGVKDKSNSAMKRGKDREPAVRSWYARLIGREIKSLCGYHNDYPWMKASLDGWIPQTQTAVEIKCPGVRKDGSSDHYDALEGRVPDKYLPQLWHIAAVTEARAIHYLSHGDPAYFPPLQQFAAVVLYTQENNFLEKSQLLFSKELKFWEYVTTNVAPNPLDF